MNLQDLITSLKVAPYKAGMDGVFQFDLPSQNTCKTQIHNFK